MSSSVPRILGRIVLWSFACIGAATTGIAIFFALFPPAHAHGPRHTARARLTQIGNALAFYEIDNGRFPSTTQGLDALLSKPEIPPIPDNYPRSGYFKSRNLLEDPWGHPFMYEAKGDCYRLYSLGRDQRRGGEGEDADLMSERGCESS